MQLVRRVVRLHRHFSVGTMLRPRIQWWFVCLVCMSFGLSSCSDGFKVCTKPGFAGVAVKVRDQLGRPAALGTKLVVHDGTFSDSSVGEYDPLILGTADNRDGLYDLRVSRPWYRDTLVENVRVPGDGCGAIETVTIPVTLSLIPGAPAVRNVVVIPPSVILGEEGIEVLYHSYVDAEPGVSEAVSWSSSDTTIVAISETGVAVSRCRTHLGDAVITAVSLADTTKRGEGYITVYTNAAICP